MKTISIMTPCYNEVGNIRELVDRVKANIPLGYAYEHILIDNASTDGTKELLREIAAEDKNVKVIFNAGNYGHIRSPYHGMLQTAGDATICMASDLQDPPELIPELVEKWENGAAIVIAVKNKSKENKLFYAARSLYYKLLSAVSDNELINHFTGFGLYEKRVVEALKRFQDPYPYLRGLLAQVGFTKDYVYFTQPKRKSGKTKNNLYTLFDIAMLGFVNNTKVPLRCASIVGFGLSALSLLIALFYFVYKLLNWESFSLGVAPLVIGLFFFSSIQLVFIGIVGEYVGAIYTQCKNAPLVIEEERINF